MRPYHIIHASAITAFLAIVSSVVLAYSGPTPVSAVVTPPVEQEATTSTVIFEKTTKLGPPMADALGRVTKKTFGMEIHPETSPVPNDRFDGFHVGVDFETTEDEKDIDVPVFAVCDGPLIFKNFVKGYGGLAVQSCLVDGEGTTVMYGHLDIESVKQEPRDRLERGQTVGVLGEGYSEETDGVRKHLHLGLHRGTEMDVRGYVTSTTDIVHWMDVLPYLRP